MYYESTGRAFVRVPLFPLQDAFVLVDMILSRSANDALEQGGNVLKEAILSASPSLFQQLHNGKDNIQRGTSTWNKQDHTLAKYILRAGGRPTPFAELAGIAPLQLSDHTDVKLDTLDKYVRKSRADCEYVRKLARKMELSAYEFLSFVTNPSTRTKWYRLEILVAANQPKNSIRNTTLVDAVLRYARISRSWEQLVDFIFQMFPGTELIKVESVLKTLVEHEFLLSDARPSLYRPDPLEDLLQNFHEGSIDRESELGEDLCVASEMQNLLNQASSLPIGKATNILNQIFSLSKNKENRPQHYVATDTSIALKSNFLSKEIVRSCDQAARLLFRLSALPRRYPWIVNYHRKFMERYTYEEIPLLELIDETTGLGLPEGYSSSTQWIEQNEATRKRDRVLLELAGMAVRKGIREIHLDESLIKQLEIDPEWERGLPNSLDMFVQIEYSTNSITEREESRIVVAPRVGDTPAWKSIGRFCHVLPDEITSELNAHALWEENLNPAIIFCDLAYVPTSGHAANVALRPRAYSYELPINLQPSYDVDRTIYVEDIMVGAWFEGLYLRDRKSGKRVILRSMHLLNPTMAPEVCRILQEISEDGVGKVTGFDWGAARSLPYLPRVASGNIVLSLARWFVSSDLKQDMPFEVWKERFIQWKMDWSLPSLVLLIDEGDMYIPLDLELMSNLLLLHRHVTSKRNALRSISLQENLVSHWVKDAEGRDYVGELIVPLLAVNPRPERVCSAENLPVTGNKDELSKPPGSDWLFFKLYGDKEYQDDLLIEFGEFAQRELVSFNCQWFFVRYIDPVPHIRLRIHGDPGTLNKEVYHNISFWLRSYFLNGLVSRIMLDTYDREVRRYGGFRTMDISEEFFHLDSRTVIQILQHQRLKKVFEDKVTLGVISLHYFLTLLGLTEEEIWNFISTAQDDRQGQYSKREAGDAFRKRRRVIMKTLLDRTSQDLLGAPNHLSQSIREFCSRVSIDAEGTIQRLLPSLAHMHLNRLGIMPSDEAQVYHHVGRAYDALRHDSRVQVR